MSVEETIEATDVSGEESAAEQVEETVEEVDTNDEASEDGGEDGGEGESVLSDEEDAEGDSDEDSDEGYKKNASNRIRDLVERSKSAEKELADLKARFEESQRQQENAKKPFVELDMGRIEADIASMYDQIDDLKLEGKVLEAAKIQRKITNLMDAVDENEKTKQEWTEKQTAQETVETARVAKAQELENAAQFYQKEMKIPDDVWDASGLWLKNELEAKPLVGKKFSDIFDRQGPIAAVEWAHQYILENMGKEAKDAKAKKEGAKKTLVGGQSTTSSQYSNLKTFDDLMKLSGTEIEKLEQTNPKLFNKLITSKLK